MRSVANKLKPGRARPTTGDDDARCAEHLNGRNASRCTESSIGTTKDTHAKLLGEINGPEWAKSVTDGKKTGSSRAMPRTDSREPMQEKLLIERNASKCKGSSIDSSEESCAKPLGDVDNSECTESATEGKKFNRVIPRAEDEESGRQDLFRRSGEPIST